MPPAVILLRGFSNRNDGERTGQALTSRWPKISTSGTTNSSVITPNTNPAAHSFRRRRRTTGVAENTSRTDRLKCSPGLSGILPASSSRATFDSAVSKSGQGHCAEPVPRLSEALSGSTKNS